MNDVVIFQQARAYKKAWTANASTSSFASRIPTITEPTNDGVIDLTGGNIGIVVPHYVFIVPYGLGSDEDAFDMKVIGWHHIGPGLPQSTPLWVPTTIGEFTCTVGTATGVAAAPVINTELFVDTIVVKSAALTPKTPGFDATPAATFSTQMVVYSPVDNTLAWILLPLNGMEKIEFTFDQTNGTPTMNCLLSFI